jgi:hypothetical protein
MGGAAALTAGTATLSAAGAALLACADDLAPLAGGLVGLAAAAGVVVWWRRRARRQIQPIAGAEATAMQVTADIPIACTLSSAQLPERLAWIRQVTAQSLKTHRLVGTTLHLTYAHEARAELERIVAGERQCCGFLRFDLQDKPGAVELTIHTPGDAGADARWLFDQFLPQPNAAKACGCSPGACG